MLGLARSFSFLLSICRGDPLDSFFFCVGSESKKRGGREITVHLLSKDLQHEVLAASVEDTTGVSFEDYKIYKGCIINSVLLEAAPI